MIMIDCSRYVPYLFIKRQKIRTPKVWSNDLMYGKPFGYQISSHTPLIQLNVLY